MNNLGGVYAERVLGVGRRTWSGAFVACEAALEVFTRDESPIEWARTTNNLGNAYRHRSTAGEVADLNVPWRATARRWRFEPSAVMKMPRWSRYSAISAARSSN